MLPPSVESYWRPWTAALASSRVGRLRPRPRRSTAWGVLGAPRLHCTIATGTVVTKEAAGEYALDVFDTRFHPLIEDALAYWRCEPARLDAPPDERRELTAEFVLEVVNAAAALEAVAELRPRPRR